MNPIPTFAPELLTLHSALAFMGFLEGRPRPGPKTPGLTSPIGQASPRALPARADEPVEKGFPLVAQNIAFHAPLTWHTPYYKRHDSI